MAEPFLGAMIAPPVVYPGQNNIQITIDGVEWWISCNAILACGKLNETTMRLVINMTDSIDSGGNKTTYQQLIIDVTDPEIWEWAERNLAKATQISGITGVRHDPAS